MNLLRRQILERQRVAVNKCQSDRFANKDEQSDLEWQVFWDAGDTEDEQEEISAGPTSPRIGRPAWVGRCFSRQQGPTMLFLKVLKCQGDLRTLQDQVRREVLRELIEDYPLAAALINRDPILIGTLRRAESEETTTQVRKAPSTTTMSTFASMMVGEKMDEYDGLVNSVIDAVGKIFGRP